MATAKGQCITISIGLNPPFSIYYKLIHEQQAMAKMLFILLQSTHQYDYAIRGLAIFMVLWNPL